MNRTIPNGGAILLAFVRRTEVGRDDRASYDVIWADSLYRSRTKEEWLAKNGLKSDIHQRKPKGRPVPETMLRANGRRSKIRSAVEHVFARQKDKMKLFIRTPCHCMTLAAPKGPSLHAIHHEIAGKAISSHQAAPPITNSAVIRGLQLGYATASKRPPLLAGILADQRRSRRSRPVSCRSVSVNFPGKEVILWR